jgi:hypothetical protein
MPLQRHFLAKVFDQDGTTFLKTFSTDRADGVDTGYLKGSPSFESRINGGYGELVLDLALPFDDFDEGSSVDFMNVVKVYAVSVDDDLVQTDTLIYTGFVSKYEPYVDEGQEGVHVTCLGLVSLLALSYYKSGTSFEVAHSGEDPSVIAEAVIDHFNTVYGGSLLSYSGDSVSSVGTNVSVTFTDQHWSDALTKLYQLAGTDWWWKVDEAGVFWLQPKPGSPTHTFTIGKDVLRITAPKDSEKVVNDVQVRRSDGTASDYSDATSQATFGSGSPATGKRSEILSDSTLTDANAADQRGNKEVADNKDAKTKATVTVTTDYPIETVKVGQTCNIRNLKGSFFADNLLIVAVRYDGDTVEVDLDQQTSFGTELAGLIASSSSTSTSSGSGSGSGGSSTSGFVDKEVPSGSINGTNTVFTVASTPVAGSTNLWLNGVLQTPGGVDYTESGVTQTFVTAPPVGSTLLVSYRTSNGSFTFADAETPSGSIDGSNTAFTIAHPPTTGSLHLYLNGILQNEGDDYTLSGTAVTMASAPPAGSVLLAYYRY